MHWLSLHIWKTTPDQLSLYIFKKLLLTAMNMHLRNCVHSERESETDRQVLTTLSTAKIT